MSDNILYALFLGMLDSSEKDLILMHIKPESTAGRYSYEGADAIEEWIYSEVCELTSEERSEWIADIISGKHVPSVSYGSTVFSICLR